MPKQPDIDDRVKPANKRGAARLAAVQALYQMDIVGTGVMETVAEYENVRLGKEINGDTYLAADASWFRGAVAGVVEQVGSGPFRCRGHVSAPPVAGDG